MLRDVAVTARILIQILLVIGFRREEIAQRLDQHRQRRTGLSLLPHKDFPDGRQLALIRVEDAGAVLDAFVVALLVDGQRVNHHEIELQQLPQFHARLVVIHPDGLRVAAIAADILVAGRLIRAVGVPDLRGRHTFKLIKKLLQAPETASRQIDGLHRRLLHHSRCLDRVHYTVGTGSPQESRRISVGFAVSSCLLWADRAIIEVVNSFPIRRREERQAMNGSSLTARFLSLLLILLFVALSAGADGNETYLAWNGSGYTETVIPHEAAVLTAQDTSWSGWYRASGSLSISRRVTVNGDASLILMDSCTLTIPAGITVNSGASLTIYAQSDSAETAGKLLVTAPSNYDAGIGGTQNHQTGTILIRGGRIESTGKNGAAIGGASGQDGGVLEISGGTVVAVSLDGGAAIGGGINKSGGEITILSGTVEAVGYTYSAGIGGGNNGGSGTVTIRGGTVTASGGYGAAIGSGYTAKTSGTILIQSGRVTATSSSGAAIGGGQKAAAGTIRIENGVISAAAANGGAGIGLGDSGKDALIELSWTDASCSIHASTYR